MDEKVPRHNHWGSQLSAFFYLTANSKPNAEAQVEQLADSGSENDHAEQDLQGDPECTASVHFWFSSQL